MADSPARLLPTALLAPLLVTAASACGDSDNDAGGELPVHTSGWVTPVPTAYGSFEVPTLTPEQQTAVTELIDADPTVSGILGDREYRIKQWAVHLGSIDPATRKHRASGGTATMEVQETIPSVEFDAPGPIYRTAYEQWPEEFKARYPVPYRLNSMRTKVENLREMDVGVDLEHKNVIRIFVPDRSFEDGGQAVSYPSEEERPEELQGRETDARAIFEQDKWARAIVSQLQYEIPFISAYRLGDYDFASLGLRLDSQKDILEADWPTLLDFDPETGDYDAAVIHFQADRFDQLNVRVDLEREVVISIEAGQSD
jgi:hypothetical protein